MGFGECNGLLLFSWKQNHGLQEREGRFAPDCTLQVNSCAWAFKPLKRNHGHPWAWWTSQNTRAHSWERLELGECPLLGSFGKQCISHSFGYTLYYVREPGGTHAKKTVRSLCLLLHTSTLCYFLLRKEKSIHFLTRSSSPRPTLRLVPGSANGSGLSFSETSFNKITLNLDHVQSLSLISLGARGRQ